jgi:integrase
MKAKNEHTVPLSDEALDLLRSLAKAGDLVFPGAVWPAAVRHER